MRAWLDLDHAIKERVAFNNKINNFKEYIERESLKELYILGMVTHTESGV